MTIKIRVAEAEKVNGFESLFISFPYDQDLVNLMREQPSRFWHKESKEWEVPANRLPSLLPLFGNRHIVIEGMAKGKQETVSLPDGFTFKTEPYSYQREGVEYGLNKTSFILGDEQGLGKTKQVIDLAIARRMQKPFAHALIICGVNGLKWNWRAEIAKHSNETGYILGTRYRKKSGREYDGGTKAKLEDLDNLPNDFFLITNMESLRSKEIANKIAQLAKQGVIGMIAFDEIHKCKNPSSQQGKGLLKIKADLMVAMSGTPLMNSPLDLYVPLKWLGYEKHNFYQFKNRYAVMGGYGGYQVVGYRNLAELQNVLDSIMLRRLKKDVLDLPEKVYITEYVEMGEAQEKIYDEVLAAVRRNIDKIVLSPNPLAQLIRLRQATGYTGILSSDIRESAKLDRLEELVEDAVESGDKVIVFSNWKEMIVPAFERLKKYNPAVITGETKDRVAEQDKFMNDDSCKVILGTTGAMGTGLTLTAGSTVIFLDSPWNRANKEQAEDRAHRIGTKSNVTIITLVTKGTIDERIEELIYQKGAMADLLV
ncbi:MAG TPA: DEAD/DEAH box helicase, partial [Fervidobacterium sp.]|nr:DEAD/DEAH box helicase [Fervidobacterium sp.]